jgi:anti-sigma B factor antagonist
VAARTPSHSFEILVDPRGRVTVVRVKGEVDAVTAPRMAQAVERLLSRRANVVLDLEAVEFMDLHGLAVLMRASRRARSDGGSFAIAHPAFCVRRLVELVRAENALNILPDGSDPLDAA